LENEYFDLIVLNISGSVLFLAVIISNYKEKITGKVGVGFVISSVIMFITIQKSLQLYYKQKLLIQELNETKEELEKKKQEIQELEKENLNFSKTSHSIAHKQKSLEYKINQLMLKNETASEIDIKDRLENITKELQQETTVELEKTNIPEIDDMLAYMQSECKKNKIEFQIQISGNIHHMTNKYIEKEKLEILIADHIKNAIIAINNSNNSNKSILVKLGIIEGVYSLYIYDSGIEFEIDTLANLGRKPSTTHADSGGTGMGFMNTFDTLKKYQASMIIYEYSKPCKNNFTKLIQIKFDNKNEFKICSYRENEIEGKINL
jgi:signal transduction histidine kinase